MIEVSSFPELAFDERRHIYKLNGIELPSVTTIMQPLTNDVYGFIDRDILDRAAARGTAVHNAIENYVKFGFDDIAPEYNGYFNAFLDWYEMHEVQPYASETKLYHKGLMYAGTADMIARVDGVDTLIDFKTASQASEMLYGVQLEAYSRALSSHGMAEGLAQAVVHLDKKGGHKMIKFGSNRTECWRVFTALLTVRNYKEQFKK